jgi:hypothetical protein
MNAQTPTPQMESNPLQRALDNYLVMELQCEAAKREAADLRAESGKLVAEISMLRERLTEVEAERRKWHMTASTLLGRLLGINDAIAGAVKQSVQSGLDATAPIYEPGEVDAVAAAASQCAGVDGGTETAPEAKASYEPPHRVLAAVPQNEFRR